MGVPQPVHDLTGHCSVIYNNTLYAYSPAGFQSLELSEGGKWKSLSMDLAVTGGKCVKVAPEGDANGAKLFIVGGTLNSTAAAALDYPGLMFYSFAQKKWDWLEPASRVTKNRLNHGATYLPASRKILVYSGSQEPGNLTPSDATFTILIDPPFVTDGFQGNGAPPVLKPMVMPWDEKHAVMLGGGATNKAVFLFDVESGWKDLGVTLEKGIADQDQVQCTVVSGDDGSKVLEMFDMSVSPNKISRIALLKKGGAKADPGQTVGGKRKRLTIADWPTYNGTLAPTATRIAYSVAQEDDGVAVITGGNKDDPLCMFDQKANAWVNATELFDGQQVIIQSEPTPSATLISSLAPSSTGTVAPSSSASSTNAPAVAPAPTNNKSRMLTVLAATLGAIFSIAALLILLLFFLKYKKNKKRRAQQTGYVEKDRLSFADRGAEFMSEAGGSVGHNYSQSQSSLAIISQSAPKHQRGMASDASEAALVMKKSPLGYSETVELEKLDMKPEPATLVRQNSNRNQNSRPPPSRSSGWSRYFANNEATNLAHMSTGTFASERSSTGSHSIYNDSRTYSHPPPGIAPLDIPKIDGQPINHVATGSPTLGNSCENLHVPIQGMSAELARADSTASNRSDVSHDNNFDRAGVESWTPVGNPATYDRPPSSVYGDSHNNHDGASSYYHGATSSYYPKSGYSSFFAPGPPPVRESTATVFPGPGAVPQINHDRDSDIIFPMQPPGAPRGHDSTYTVFPGPGASSDKPQTDMSWLNLGTSNK